MTLSAEQGFPDAQYFLSYMYSFGEGVKKDLIRAYLWLSVAIANAERNMVDRYLQAYNRLIGAMTPAQVKEGQRLSKDWLDIYKKKR